MPRRRFTPEQIIQHLREAEVLLSQDKTIAQACEAIGVTEQTYYRWRVEYNTVRPHSSLGYRPPAPEAILPRAVASATLQHIPLEEFLKALN